MSALGHEHEEIDFKIISLLNGSSKFGTSERGRQLYYRVKTEDTAKKSYFKEDVLIIECVQLKMLLTLTFYLLN